MARVGSSYKTKNEFSTILAEDIASNYQLTLFDPSIGENQEYVVSYLDFINNLEKLLTTRQVFTPTQSQTVFTLSRAPTDSEIPISRLYLNGQKLLFNACYAISGTQLTVILPYDLDSNDVLEINY